MSAAWPFPNEFAPTEERPVRRPCAWGRNLVGAISIAMQAERAASLPIANSLALFPLNVATGWGAL
ncbi:hypothetical protein D9M68_918250 [compost metagenome]